MIKLSQRAPTTCASQPTPCQNRWLTGVLVSIVVLSLYTSAFARSLSILLMPLESSDTTKVEAFTKSDNSYDRLKFDNTETDWRKLEIGYQHWLCGELQKFAQEERLDEIIVRFISWDQAKNEIDSLWKDFDLIQVPSTWTAYLIDEGILAKWDEDVDLQNYPARLLDTCRIEGKKDIYAVPWQIDLRVLFYRKELTDDPNEIKTFDDFLTRLNLRKEQMESATDTVWEAPFCIAKDRDWDILHNTLRYFWHGKIIEKYMRFWWKPVFDNNEGVEGIEKLRKMAKGSLVYFGNFQKPNGKPAWHGQAKGLLEGKYDAVFGGIYMRTVFDKRTDVKILAAPLPQLLLGEAKTFLGGSHLAVTRAASKTNSRKARKLIYRLTNEQTGVSMFGRTNAVPAHKDALKEFFETDPICKGLDLGKLLKSAEAYPSVPQWAELETNVVRDNFHDIVRGIADGQSQQTIESHVHNAAKEVRHILLLYLLKKSFPTLIVIFTVSLVIITWLIHKWRKSQQKTEELRRELEKARQEVDKQSQELSKTKKDILERLKESGKVIRDEISKEFNTAQGHLIKLQHDITDMKSDILSIQGQLKYFNNFSEQFMVLESCIESIITKIPEDFPTLLQQSLEVFIHSMDKIREEIFKRLPQSEVSWADITVEVTLQSVIPMNVKIVVTGPKEPVTETITGATAAWLAEIIRNRDLHTSFHVWAKGSIVTNVAAERAARRPRKILQDAVIKVAGGKLPGLDKKFLLMCYERGCYRLNLPQELKIESPIEQARQSLDEAEQNNSIDMCISAVSEDPGNSRAWKKLVEFVENSENPDQVQNYVRENVEENTIRDLRHTLIRYLNAANVCCAEYQKSEQAEVCGRAASSVMDGFAKEAEGLLQALNFFPEFPETPQSNWGEFLVSTLEYKWLAPLINTGNLEYCLCVGAICNSHIWSEPPENHPQLEDIKQALMGTKWFKKTVTELTEKTSYCNEDAKEIFWWVLSTAFKKGDFPGLPENMGKSLIEKLKKYSSSDSSGYMTSKEISMDPGLMDKMFPNRGNVE